MVPSTPQPRKMLLRMGQKERLQPLWFEHGLEIHEWFYDRFFEVPKRNDNAKRLGDSRKLSKHLTVFSPQTVNIKRLANLTANNKNYGQMAIITKLHSNPVRLLTFSTIFFSFVKSTIAIKHDRKIEHKVVLKFLGSSYQLLNHTSLVT